MRLEDLRQYGLQRRTEPREQRSQVEIEALLTGDIVALGQGRCFYREERFGPEYQHGPHLLREIASVSGRHFAAVSRDPELAYADLSSAVFLDTETTGLGMGAGTYVFLVGAGYADGSAFRVRQFFLSGPGEEVSFLNALQRFLGEFAVIVTFNGKAFDWPLLEGRFARYRRPPPLADPPHVDLLHPSRRLWKRRLESCALSSLEREILGFHRTREDVPGWEIPYRYFNFLRAGDGAGLEGVFYHNLQDVLSMAALSVFIDRVLCDPFAGLLQHGIDFYSLGRLYDGLGEGESAIMCYEEALRRTLTPDQRCDCMVRLSAGQKRMRWWDGALQTWDRLVDQGGGWALYALTEIAKYHEHVERDYSSALEAVRHAMVLVELRPGSPEEAEVAELEHRLGRLLNREARTRVRGRTRTQTVGQGMEELRS